MNNSNRGSFTLIHWKKINERKKDMHIHRQLQQKQHQKSLKQNLVLDLYDRHTQSI